MKKSNLLKSIIALILTFLIIMIILIITKMLDKSKEVKEVENEIKQQVDEITSIKDRYECNEFEYININVEDLILLYINDYKECALENPNKAYNLLDEEYREKRFGNVENYKKYVEDNKEMIKSITLKSYKVEKDENDNNTYICLDQYSNYYIFKTTGIMEYTLIADFYTIDLEGITSNYDKSNVQERVAMNIQKVISALNNKDYKYVYSKLAEGFKENKYPTQEAFESYISEIIYDNKTVSFGGFHNEGETYIYDIILVSPGNTVNMQIIMQLKDNRDFVMSFNMGE